MTDPSPLITSRQNQRVKDAVRLRTGRNRQRAGRFLIDGAREIQRALDAGIRPREAFVRQPLDDEPGALKALNALRSTDTEILFVTPAVYEKLCFGDREDAGIVVVAESPDRRLTQLRLPDEPLVAVLEGIEKPGNLGAILRSADAAGVDAVVVADARTDLFNPNTIRASLGTVFRESVVTATSTEAIAGLRERHFRIIAARPDAELLYTMADFRGSVAIVLGSEVEGLSDQWRELETDTVRLPMRGVADSLNVSTAAAVLFYEALRQRG